MQVKRELEWLYKETGADFASCVGGMDMRTERRALDRGAHIVVGTPGRLRDHIERGSLDLTALKAVVLDEADEMLDMGFRDDLEYILGAAPKERRTLNVFGHRSADHCHPGPNVFNAMPYASPPRPNKASMWILNTAP